MNKNLLFIFISFIAITFFLASSAEAKRFGGGSSFGSKKSYSSPFKKSTQQKSFSQQKASATNQQRKQQMSKRGGLMGMLGGLALGGLLGALFFGGAFENFNFFDFLIIGGIIFAVIWFMKRKALTPRAQTAGNTGFNGSTDTASDNFSQTDSSQSQNQFKLNSAQKNDKQDATFSDSFSADKDSSANKKDASFADSFGMNYGQSSTDDQDTASDNEVILPDWFDQEEFLSGARSAYTQLQQAWDKGDLESIKGLTTDNVYSEITHQFAQEASQGETRILQLNAQLIDFNESDDHSEASVLFDALLDEDAAANTQGRANQTRELWHFVRGKNSTEPTWYLDGIQQLE